MTPIKKEPKLPNAPVGATPLDSAPRKMLYPTAGNPYKASNGRLWVQCPNCCGWETMKRVASCWRLRWCSKCNIVWKMQ